jgi:hypothetical protein
MDDFNVSSLHESKNEWGARLLIILTPLIIEGFKSIFDEAYNLCKTNRETEKYLMTFQNLLARIPKWNSNIIEAERKRIIERSRCSYLEELVTCIHIIQLKLLTAMRVGQKQKKIDINIPKLDDFLHKIYIFVARKIYKNVYLFEKECSPLEIQKHNRELELIVQECILNAVRDSIPVESILKVYMDETTEEDVVEEIQEQVIDKPPEITEDKNSNKETIKFNDVDIVLNGGGKKEFIEAPKTIERLEEISNLRNMQRKIEEEDDDSLKISEEPVNLDLKIESLEEEELLPLDIDDII